MDAASKNDQASREIVSARVIAAPPEAVFACLAEPDRLARWWGPAGFRNTFETFEFRPGGIWKFVMHGPDGTDWPNHSVFREIEAPARLVVGLGVDAKGVAQGVWRGLGLARVLQRVRQQETAEAE